MTPEAESYSRHMNLKIAADEIGIPWQTLYVKLKRQGVAVCGDKSRYGTDRDKLGALAEGWFEKLVPKAENQNKFSFQPKVDFLVSAAKVDVKASRKSPKSKKSTALSWAFSLKKQSLTADFMCCFCCDEDKRIEHVLLLPIELVEGKQTITVSCTGASKWFDYKIEPYELAEFFDSIAATH